MIDLLAINCAVTNEHEHYKLKLLIERYSMLKNLKITDKFSSVNLIEIYKSTAFNVNQ